MSFIFSKIYLYIQYGRLTSRHGCDVASVELDEEIMTAEDANKIISFLSAGYAVCKDATSRAEFNRLANKLRKASKQSTK